jgi:hypothetical protein
LTAPLPKIRGRQPSARLVGADGSSVDVSLEIAELLFSVVGELKLGNGVSVVALKCGAHHYGGRGDSQREQAAPDQTLEAGVLAYRKWLERIVESA